jgi:hypothetical protein
MHHLHREVAAALLRERDPDVATSVEGAFVERVLALGGRLEELWDAVVKGTASTDEQRLSWLLAPAGVRLPCFHDAQKEYLPGTALRLECALAVLCAAMGIVHSN